MIVTDISELRQPIEEVSLNEAQEIIPKLEVELAKQSNGVGLAAPQIGIKKKVAIIRFKEHSMDLINPIVVDKKQIINIRDEGCLSFPNFPTSTRRYKEIFVRDLKRPDGFVGVGSIAIVLQHEIDHLEGILIIDRAINNRIGRNDCCPCGSNINGKPVKFKKCHGKNW